jgi:hypothetical protein
MQLSSLTAVFCGKRTGYESFSHYLFGLPHCEVQASSHRIATTIVERHNCKETTLFHARNERERCSKKETKTWFAFRSNTIVSDEKVDGDPVGADAWERRIANSEWSFPRMIIRIRRHYVPSLRVLPLMTSWKEFGNVVSRQ